MKRRFQNFIFSKQAAPREQDPDASPSQATSLPYSDLPGHGYIRLLGLERPSRRNLLVASLRCTLTVVSLADPGSGPSYLALSYSWPNQKTTSSIVCNGHPVKVRPGLVAALQHIWSDEPDHLIWVDAVCIRQDNISERNNQVGLMAEIYQHARKVIVWLGSEERGMLPVFDVIADFQNDDSATHERLSKLFHKGGSITTLTPDYELYESLESLSDLPWFSRCWTFQEIVLSRKAVIFLGSLRMDWSTFRDTIMSLKRYPEPFSSFRQLVDTVELIDRTIADHRTRKIQFHDLLVRTKTREATDARDKVYALLGLSVTSVKPEYELTSRQVFVNAAKECIRSTNDLSTCFLAGLQGLTYADQTLVYDYQQAYPWSCDWTDRPEDKNTTFDRTGGWFLPSWVPDFGSTVQNGNTQELKFQTDKKWPAHIADLRDALPEPFFEGEVLVTHGFVLGRLALSRDGKLHSLPECTESPDIATHHASRWAESNMSCDDAAVVRFLASLVHHDRGLCCCETDLSTVTTAHALDVPRDAGTGDYLCLLKDSPLLLILRPDFQYRPDSVNGSGKLQARRQRQSPFTVPSEMPASTFVLVSSCSTGEDSTFPKLFSPVIPRRSIAQLDDGQAVNQNDFDASSRRAVPMQFRIR